MMHGVLEILMALHALLRQPTQPSFYHAAKKRLAGRLSPTHNQLDLLLSG
jgi:hypothetical protein